MFGYAFLKQRKKFEKWLKESGLPRITDRIDVPEAGWYYSHWTTYGYMHQEILSKTANNGVAVENIFDIHNSIDHSDHFLSLLDHLEKVGQKLCLFFRDDFACIVGYGRRRFIMPAEWFEYEILHDYNEISSKDIKELSGAHPSLFPSTVYYNSADLKTAETALKKQEETIEEKQRSIENGTEDSLIDLQRKIERLQEELEEKKRALTEELDRKKEELAERQKELKRKSYILDAQIYGIRCYLGEVVDFHKVRSGREAEKEEPVVLYQKIRFLDEEMGKWASLYDFEGTRYDKSSFLSLLHSRDDLFELFTPSSKCMTVCRISRTGKFAAASRDIANAFAEYEKYHGEQLAVLIRNGENLYISWLDEEKVKISDENVFYNPTAKAKEMSEEDAGLLKESSTEEKVSRYYLLSLLQGILDSGKLLTIPEKVNVYRSTPYIVYSMAEGGIEDHRYGTFEDILEKSKDIPLKEGDRILVGLSLGRDDARRQERYSTYSNDRGIGEKNRTHDAHIPSGVHRINKVLYDYEFELSYDMKQGLIEEMEGEFSYTAFHTDGSFTEEKKTGNGDIIRPTGKVIGEGKEKLTVSFSDSEVLSDYNRYTKENNIEKALQVLVKRMGKRAYAWFYLEGKSERRSSLEESLRWNGYFTPEKASEKERGLPHFQKEYKSVRLVRKIPHYFVSVNAVSYSGSIYKANMEIYPDEFLNLTYLCPTWIRYVITTANVGNFVLNGYQFSYAEALRYLKKALEISSEEYEEIKRILIRNGLEEWIDGNSDWDVQVCEWRIGNRVRKMSEYQVKRLVNQEKIHEQTISTISRKNRQENG